MGFYWSNGWVLTPAQMRHWKLLVRWRTNSLERLIMFYTHREIAFQKKTIPAYIFGQEIWPTKFLWHGNKPLSLQLSTEVLSYIHCDQTSFEFRVWHDTVYTFWMRTALFTYSIWVCHYGRNTVLYLCSVLVYVTMSAYSLPNSTVRRKRTTSTFERFMLLWEHYPFFLVIVDRELPASLNGLLHCEGLTTTLSVLMICMSITILLFRENGQQHFAKSRMHSSLGSLLLDVHQSFRAKC